MWMADLMAAKSVVAGSTPKWGWEDETAGCLSGDVRWCLWPILSLNLLMQGYDCILVSWPWEQPHELPLVQLRVGHYIKVRVRFLPPDRADPPHLSPENRKSEPSFLDSLEKGWSASQQASDKSVISQISVCYVISCQFSFNAMSGTAINNSKKPLHPLVATTQLYPKFLPTVDVILNHEFIVWQSEITKMKKLFSHQKYSIQFNSVPYCQKTNAIW